LVANTRKKRKRIDPVGFATTPEQLEPAVRNVAERNQSALSKTKEVMGAADVVAVLSPHDDYAYALLHYLHVVPLVAEARTVMIFGVTHEPARNLLQGRQGGVLLDDHEEWEAPYGPVSTDKELLEAIEKEMPVELARIDRDAHELEHSIEALVPLLQMENRDVKLLPVMVTKMAVTSMVESSRRLASIIFSYCREKKLVLGHDLAFIFSGDAVHYGPDFDYHPFGLDMGAHDKATARDREIFKTYLEGIVEPPKIIAFAERLLEQGVTWCPRYSLPYGLLFLSEMAGLEGRNLRGTMLSYGDSYRDEPLPRELGLGTTAPRSLEHFVGYIAAAFTFE